MFLMNGVTEAAAILHRVGDDDPECYQRHHSHHEQGKPAHQSSADGKEQEDADGKLAHGKQYRHYQCAPRWEHPVDVQRLQIVGYLILRAQRVNSLHESREDERCCQEQSPDVYRYLSCYLHHVSLLLIISHSS